MGSWYKKKKEVNRMVLENFIETLCSLGDLLWNLLDSVLVVGAYIVLGFVVSATISALRGGKKK